MEPGVRHFQKSTKSLQTRGHCRAVAVFSAADLTNFLPQRTCYSDQLLFSKDIAPIDKQSDLCNFKFEGIKNSDAYSMTSHYLPDEAYETSLDSGKHVA